jgi:hypothetical protein
MPAEEESGSIRITYRSLRPIRQRFEDHGSQVLVLGRLVGASRLE